MSITATDAFRRPHDPQNTKLGFAVQFAKDRVQICLEKHRDCPHQSETYLPTRVIDVWPSDGSREPRLLVTADVQYGSKPEDWHQKHRYIALSYCWGTKKNFTTTLDSFAPMQVQIPWAELPPTIKDAIDVTRALGIQYLWVDALCIIQDSPEDWSAEAAKMASVYGGAFLTISAALGPDVYHGLFRTTSQETSGSKKPLEDEPLYKRAWALQERILSPRILIFGSNKLYWECRTTQQAETGENIPLPLCTRLPLYPSDNLWYTIVRDYTCRLMSDEADKLPALAGLAAAYGTATGKSYIVGLWKESLLRDLLWQQSWWLYGNKVQPSFPMQYRAPSWSWASLDGNIINSAPMKTQLSAEVLSTFHDAAEIAVTSGEQNEWICLKGPLFQTSIKNGCMILGNELVCPFIDNGQEQMTTSSVWCLLFNNSVEARGLVLARVEKATTERDFDVYQRVGMFIYNPTTKENIWQSISIVYII